MVNISSMLWILVSSVKKKCIVNTKKQINKIFYSLILGPSVQNLTLCVVAMSGASLVLKKACGALMLRPAWGTLQLTITPSGQAAKLYFLQRQDLARGEGILLN